MRKRIFAPILSIVVSAFVAGPAGATMVAGWDFSQYFNEGLLSIDGATFTDTLDANYSNLDSTFNAGAESAAFGTMFMDGSFGSTDVVENQAGAAFVPTSGSLTSNLNAPVVGGGLNPFDSFTILEDEGQEFTNLLSMTAQDIVSVVFEADLTTVPEFGTDWSISFGGQTFSGASNVGIEFSTDGATYASFGSVTLDTTDAPFTVALSAEAADTAFVRLSFNPAEGQPKIDNVAINANVVPEPSTVLLCGLGLVGLGVWGRRHKQQA